jgi:hypothetical protein
MFGDVTTGGGDVYDFTVNITAPTLLPDNASFPLAIVWPGSVSVLDGSGGGTTYIGSQGYHRILTGPLRLNVHINFAAAQAAAVVYVLGTFTYQTSTAA